MKFLPTKKKKERNRAKEERPDRQQKRGMLEERRLESREKTEHQHSEVHLDRVGQLENPMAKDLLLTFGRVLK